MSELQKTVVQPDDVYKSEVYPFSQAIRVQAGEFLFIAGQPSMDVEANTIGIGDMAAQTRQVYKNLGNILESVGATFGNVVELTTFVVGRENLPAHLEVISELYPTLFPDGNYPADTVAIVDGLYIEEFL
ncbi:MAG: RidA family protein, partial [Anaerolineales bacterium]|nr:RidA family protein [Anaerolineales bacterium]